MFDDNIVVAKYKEGARLWEIAEYTGLAPGYIVELLKRKKLLQQLAPLGNAELIRIKKRLNTNIAFKSPADKSSMPVGLEKWCHYYGYDLESATKAISSKDGDIFNLFTEDITNWKRIYDERAEKAAIDREKRYEKEGYPVERTSKLLWSSEFKGGKDKNPLFDNPDGEYRLCLRTTGTGIRLRKPFQQLFWELRGVMKEDIAGIGYYPCVVEEQCDYMPPGVSIYASINIIVPLNKRALLKVMKKWVEKYCYVLDEFRFGLSRVVPIPESYIGLEEMVEKKLELGER